MANPDPLLSWLGVAGGVVGLMSGAANLYAAWRNRRRIEFHELSKTCYYESWTTEDASRQKLEPTPAVRVGDCKQTFTVLEFVIANGHPIDITIGRMFIDGWMFSDGYLRGMYDWHRNYRVFELDTRARTRLDVVRTVPANGAVGFRIEVLVNANGPYIESHAHAYALNPLQPHTISFWAGSRRIEKKIGMRRQDCRSEDARFIHHWSDLVPSVEDSSTGAPLPQGLSDPSRERRVPYSFRAWWGSQVNVLLYGRPWHSSGDLSRWTLIAVLQARFRAWRARRPHTPT